MIQKRKLIFGPPGSGKTTTLLNIMESELQRGVDPSRIAFVSFTRKAANEAAERAAKKFGLGKQELPYFRTLHSLAFLMLGLKKTNVMQPRHYKELCSTLQLDYRGIIIEDEESIAEGDGDHMVFANGLARNKQLDYKKWWRSSSGDLDWYKFDLFNRGLYSYKIDTGLLDFTDFLERVIDEGEQIDIDVAIIDEAQDLTPLQWQMALQVVKGAKRVYIAGDDDQAIYHWAGSDVSKFINFQGDVTVLDRTWRLPEKLWKMSDALAKRIKNRMPKKWKPVTSGGELHYHTYCDSVNLDGNWLILARNRVFLQQFEKHAQRTGVLYSTKKGSSVNEKHREAIINWERLRRGHALKAETIKNVLHYMPHNIKHGFQPLPGKGLLDLRKLMEQHGLKNDGIWHEVMGKIPLSRREYYIAILKQGKKLTETPQVHIDTIHGVKGGEADKVLLCSDMTWRSFNGLQKTPDEETRVFYVGVTRAKKELHVMLPQTDKFYTL